MRTRAKGRSAGLSEESAGEASNLMCWPALRSELGLNHIRLRGVGFHYYRKSAGFPQGGEGPVVFPQKGFTTTKITIPIIKIVGTSLIIR